MPALSATAIKQAGCIPGDIISFKGFLVFSKWLQIRGRLQTGVGLERRGHQGVWEKTDLPLIVLKISVIPSGN